jgi:hypothetical protein
LGGSLNLYGVILFSILLISIAVISNNASTGEPTKDQMKAFEEFNRRNAGNWKADWNSFLGNSIAVFDGKYTKRKPIPISRGYPISFALIYKRGELRDDTFFGFLAGDGEFGKIDYKVDKGKQIISGQTTKPGVIGIFKGKQNN